MASCSVKRVDGQEHPADVRGTDPYPILHLTIRVNPIQGERRQQLAQTVDIVPTLAEFFQIAPP